MIALENFIQFFSIFHLFLGKLNTEDSTPANKKPFNDDLNNSSNDPDDDPDNPPNGNPPGPSNRFDRDQNSQDRNQKPNHGPVDSHTNLGPNIGEPRNNDRTDSRDINYDLSQPWNNIPNPPISAPAPDPVNVGLDVRGNIYINPIPPSTGYEHEIPYEDEWDEDYTTNFNNPLYIDPNAPMSPFSFQPLLSNPFGSFRGPSSIVSKMFTLFLIVMTSFSSVSMNSKPVKFLKSLIQK